MDSLKTVGFPRIRNRSKLPVPTIQQTTWRISWLVPVKKFHKSLIRKKDLKYCCMLLVSILTKRYTKINKKIKRWLFTSFGCLIKLEVLLSGTSATELEPLRPHCKDAECFEFTFPDNLKSLHFVLCPEFQWDLWQASELGDWKNG